MRSYGSTSMMNSKPPFTFESFFVKKGISKRYINQFMDNTTELLFNVGDVFMPEFEFSALNLIVQGKFKKKH